MTPPLPKVFRSRAIKLQRRSRSALASGQPERF
jgi:hypothetical protein